MDKNLSENEPKIPKETNLFDKVEIFLNEVVFFPGNYFMTLRDILFNPKCLIMLINGSIPEIKTGRYIKPFTYLFTNFFFFLYTFSKSFLLIDDYFKQDPEVSNEFKDAVDVITQFDVMSQGALFYLIPLVLSIAFIAKITSILSRKLGGNSSFRIQLNLYSYVFGTVFFILGIMSGAALVFYKPIFTANSNTIGIIFISLLFCFIFILFLILIYRYVQILRTVISVPLTKDF